MHKIEKIVTATHRNVIAKLIKADEITNKLSLKMTKTINAKDTIIFIKGYL